jgi:hypothetical protein
MVAPCFVARFAQVAELADALASGASSRKGVEVRVLSWAPHKLKELSCGRKAHLQSMGFAGASCSASCSHRQT